MNSVLPKLLHINASGRLKGYTSIGSARFDTTGLLGASKVGGDWQARGFPAWAMWLGIHLVFLVGLRNQLSVFLQWTYAYFTYRRGARIIMGGDR